MVTVRLALAGLAAVAAAALGALPAVAAVTVYDYHIEHPRYGMIGTYSNAVNRTGDAIEIDTELHVAVKILGIVMFREDATRTEHWQGDRFVSFTGVTVTNGAKIALSGRAQGDNFVVTSPEGTVTVPGRVHPSNPWGQQVLGTDLMMSTKTGKIDQVRVSGGAPQSVTFDGKDLRLRQYEIDGTKRQFVWLDDHGVAVAFRTEEDGSPVDFVLSHPPQSEAQNRPAQ
jgi:hypothetical protein